MNVLNRSLYRLFAMLFVFILVVTTSSIYGFTSRSYGVSDHTIAQYYSVTFCENSSTSCTVFASETENTPTDLTLFSNLSPVLTFAGYTFADWNTSPDGSGTSYTDGELYSFASASLTLYAQWTENSVTFYENSSGSDVTRSVQSGNTSEPLTLISALSPSFSDPGYDFAGWTTGQNGSGTSYGNGATYDFVNGSTALYAQWTPATVAVSFSANGGVVSTSQASYTTGSTPVTLPTPTFPGYSFAGWFSAPTGGNFVGSGGSAFTPISPTALYAQWKKLPSLTVRFSVNGGRGVVATVSSYSGATVEVPGRTPVRRPGYRFAGWNTSPSGTGTGYHAGEAVTLTSSLVLYAQWRTDSTVVMLGSVEPFAARTAALPSRLVAQVARLAVAVVRGGYSQVIVYGFTTQMGSVARQRATSVARARGVARLLRVALQRRGDRSVNVGAVGEGSVRGLSAVNSRRVEVVAR